MSNYRFDVVVGKQYEYYSASHVKWITVTAVGTKKNNGSTIYIWKTQSGFEIETVDFSNIRDKDNND